MVFTHVSSTYEKGKSSCNSVTLARVTGKTVTYLQITRSHLDLSSLSLCVDLWVYMFLDQDFGGSQSDKTQKS